MRSQTATKVKFVLSLNVPTHALKNLLATSSTLRLGRVNGKNLIAVMESLISQSYAKSQFARTLTAQMIKMVKIAGSKYVKTTVKFSIARSGTLKKETGLVRSVNQKSHCCPMYAPRMSSKELKQSVANTKIL